MGLTSDRNDPRLGHGSDTEPTGQNEVYLVLSDDELAKGFVRPVRNAYRHLTCGSTTTMGQKLSETYAANPSFYGATFCCHCDLHRPVGENGEFEWLDGSKVGT